MIDEYFIVFNEFIENSGSITSNIARFSGSISNSVLPVFFTLAACSVLITFYRNIAK